MDDCGKEQGLGKGHVRPMLCEELCHNHEASQDHVVQVLDISIPPTLDEVESVTCPTKLTPAGTGALSITLFLPECFSSRSIGAN
jgi:hypothetical protein